MARSVFDLTGSVRGVSTTSLVVLGVLASQFVSAPPAHAAPCDPPITNPIICENSKPGSPPSEWDISGAGSSALQGFATDLSVDQGGTVGFKVDTTATRFRIDIYRLGYYAGNGARRVASIADSQTTATDQPSCVNQSSTGLIDCGNWSQSASWTVPTDAVSGVHLAKLTATAGISGTSHIIFVVRDDDGASPILFQTSDTTWQAYNSYGGNSLYVGQPAGRAYKVSYNRPFNTRAHSPQDFLFNAEYPTLRFLEANGYNVSYTTGVDSDRRGNLIQQHDVFMSVGHDEYWSGTQRTNVEAARAAGVNLAFMSGNEVFWKTRWEASIAGGTTAHRTLVSYKETHANAKIDPAGSSMWTGTWRDPRFSPPADGGRPENALTGTIFMVNCCTTDMRVDSSFKDLRFWRNTRVASLPSGQQTTLGSGVLGYEWDEELDNGARPAGLVRMSQTTVSGVDRLQDHGSTYASGTATHRLTLYRAASGALVFGAGTVQWGWGLDDNHDLGAAQTKDVAVQQATVNLFADMGVQPDSLQSGLTAAAASTDTVPPTSNVTSPTQGQAVQLGQPITITGTATDSGGGVVGAVEVSTDNGQTWHPATGRSSWSYTWQPTQSGSATIKTRAVDDSGRLEPPGSGVTVTVDSCPCTIWPPTATPGTAATTDARAVELGVKFRASLTGPVTGVRFYKGLGNGGTHTGSLWSSTGTRLATVTFTGETATGWQQATFATPVSITANTTYVVSYYAPLGRYAINYDYFTTAVTRGPLTALSSASSGGNGVYRYAAGGGFPTSTYRSSNYWVDVVYGTGADTVAPTVTARVPASGATNVPVASAVSATFSEAVQQSTISMALTGPGGSAVAGTQSYDSTARRVTFTPASALADSTTYSVSVSGARDVAGNVMNPESWSFTTGAAPVCPCTIWPSTATPATAATTDSRAVELGVKFRTSVSGLVTGVRFYKGPGNSGTHVGSLWSSTGSRLATVTFSGESATGWQQAMFSTPVAVSANTTYVVSYYAPVGRYSYTFDYFAAAFTRVPLTALSSASSGGNGVYRYGGGGGFPTSSYRSANYWVDVIFGSGSDTTAPTVTTRFPAANQNDVTAASFVTARFSEPVVTGSIQSSLSGPGGAVGVATDYDTPTNTLIVTPASALAFSSTYTMQIAGARDIAGNVMAPVSWSFTTAAAPPGPPPDQGPGGPVAIVTSSSNPHSTYLAEVLRTEGLNEFATVDLSSLDAAALASFDVVVLGQVALSQSQADMLTTWVQGGGNLVAMRPDARLASLLGITRVSGTLSEAYLKVNNAVEPGAGITSETIQFHGTADRYTLSGASSVATLYSNATTATSNAAVTLRSVGTNGGHAAAFTYDLARSLVQTRQGNPAWAGQERDGEPAIIRSGDMFVPASGQPGWVDMNKVAIPQADEQQRLLANVILTINRDKKPLPRFWYFPGAARAVAVATGDDHAFGGTAERMAIYQGNSTPGCSVADWACLRFSSYVYPEVQMTDAAAKALQDDGFEIGLHPENGCRNFSSAVDLAATYAGELADWRARFPSLRSPQTNRFHCVVWSDWGSQFGAELGNGIRLDTDYYYWPGSWVANRPGFMTGSGMPMRFARPDGTIIDVYQAATQMTDESQQTYPFTPNSLFDRALGPLGYYGFFTANMHTDIGQTVPDQELVTSARQRGVPVISAKQLLDWLDGRNASSFSNLAWNGNTLSFTLNVGPGARGLRAMVPTAGPDGAVLSTLTRGGSGVGFTRETVKGVEYAAFAAAAGAYSASYAASPGAPTISSASASARADGTATVQWETNEPATSEVLIGTSQSALTSEAVEAVSAGDHVVELEGLEPGRTYFYRVASTDAGGKRSVWPSPLTLAPSFSVPPEDVNAPTISGLAISTLPDGTARVTWQTNEVSDSRVSYGAGTGLDQEAYSGSLVRRHEVVVRDLDPTTQYSIRVISTDAVGNDSSPSAVRRVTTPRAGVADQTAAAFAAGDADGAMRVDELGPGVLTLEARDGARGTFRSRVLDARISVDWDRPMWEASVPAGTTLEVRVRTGDTRNPDGIWSAWKRVSGPTDSIGETSRFLQYEVHMTASEATSQPALTTIGFTHRSTPPAAIGEVPY